MSNQIDVNQLSNALQQKVDLPSGKSQADIDYVVESKVRQSGDNYNWYRLYKSGWIEQGGYYVLSSTTYDTISLEKEMADNLYHINATYYDGDGNDATIRGCNTSNKTTTSFDAKVGVSGNNKFISWEVKGMTVQS